MKEPKPKTCKYCGLSFVPFRFMQRYCSLACVQLDTKETTKGWGKRPVINSKPRVNVNEPKEYVANREAVKNDMIAEYGFCFCQRCKTPFHKTGGLHTHHIVYRSEKPNHEFLHDKRNLICLCGHCHYWMHKAKANREPLIAERNLTELFGNSILSKKS